MIDVKKIFNSTTVTLTVYAYSHFSYTVEVDNVDIGPTKTITVSRNIASVTFLIRYANGLTEEFYCNINENFKEYNFLISYSIPIKKEHIFISTYVKKYFQGWSTAGSTSHSSTSRTISPLLLSLFSRDFELILDGIEEGRSYFPINEDSIIRSDYANMSISEISMIPFTHLNKIKEEEISDGILKIGYGKGEEVLTGNQNRKEYINGDNKYTYSSKIKYGKNNLVQKTTNDFINNQDFRSFIFNEALPIKISISNTYLTISNNNTSLSYQSSIPIEKCIVTPFGDVFILSLGNIYYAKTEVTPIELAKTNPSINNNNIVEIDSDFFSPGEDIEVVVDMEYLRGISANTIIIKVENQNSSFYITGDQSYSDTETRITDLSRKNIKFIISTEDTDEYMLVSVYVDHNPIPYISYSSGLKLDPVKINDNVYDDLYIENNSIRVRRSSGERFKLTGIYSYCFFNSMEKKYVSIKY